MKIFVRLIAATAALYLLSACAKPQQTQTTTTKVKAKLTTVAGEVKIIAEDDTSCKYAVMVNDKTVVKTNCEDINAPFNSSSEPTILKRYKQGIPPFDEVILFQQHMGGNACDGGPLWFLGLKKDGSFEMSAEIDFCGGPPAKIREAENQVIVELPGHKANRGTNYIPSETWVYEGGKVAMLKPRTRKKISKP